MTTLLDKQGFKGVFQEFRKEIVFLLVKPYKSFLSELHKICVVNDYNEVIIFPIMHSLFRSSPYHIQKADLNSLVEKIVQSTVYQNGANCTDSQIKSYRKLVEQLKEEIENANY